MPKLFIGTLYNNHLPIKSPINQGLSNNSVLWTRKAWHPLKTKGSKLIMFAVKQN